MVQQFLGNQQKGSYFPLVYHESLLFFTFFEFEVCMIENKWSEKRETFFFFFFFLINNLEINFADWPSATWPHGNIGNTYTLHLRVNVSHFLGLQFHLRLGILVCLPFFTYF